MNCRRVSSLLSAYIDGELNGFEMLAVREHVDDCKTCREDYESLRVTKQMLARMATVGPHDDFSEAILHRLDAVGAPAYQRLLSDLSSGLRVKLSPAFATVAAVSLAFLLLGARGRTPHTYDVAKVWRESPKPVALSITDLAESSFAEPASYAPPFWKSQSPTPGPQPILSFASLTR